MDKNSFLINLSESIRTDFGRVEFEKQSPVQKVFSAIWALESEVNSGGFSHYLASSEAETAPFAPTAPLTIEIAGKAKTIACTVPPDVLASFR